MSYLEVFAWMIFIPAIYKRSLVAVIYASLIAIHSFLFSGLASDAETVHLWAFSGGVFSFLSIIACYLYRQSIHDNIAFYLYNIGVLTLFVNIITVYMWTLRMNMSALDPVFLVISILSIFYIYKGTGSGIRRRSPAVHSCASTFTNARNNRRGNMVQTKKVV